MPAVADRPELEFARSIFEGPSPDWGDDPKTQLGAWMVYQLMLQKFERVYVWPFETVAPDVRQTHRAFLTSLLGMGEHLLTAPFDPAARKGIELAVRSFRDKLLIEFSECTAGKSDQLLASIFGEGILAE